VAAFATFAAATMSGASVAGTRLSRTALSRVPVTSDASDSNACVAGFTCVARIAGPARPAGRWVLVATRRDEETEATDGCRGAKSS
jgi:hypothetical protein